MRHSFKYQVKPISPRPRVSQRQMIKKKCLCPDLEQQMITNTVYALTWRHTLSGESVNSLPWSNMFVGVWFVATDDQDKCLYPYMRLKKYCFALKNIESGPLLSAVKNKILTIEYNRLPNTRLKRGRFKMLTHIRRIWNRPLFRQYWWTQVQCVFKSATGQRVQCSAARPGSRARSTTPGLDSHRRPLTSPSPLHYTLSGPHQHPTLVDP